MNGDDINKQKNKNRRNLFILSINMATLNGAPEELLRKPHEELI